MKPDLFIPFYGKMFSELDGWERWFIRQIQRFDILRAVNQTAKTIAAGLRKP